MEAIGTLEEALVQTKVLDVAAVILLFVDGQTERGPVERFVASVPRFHGDCRRGREREIRHWPRGDHCLIFYCTVVTLVILLTLCGVIELSDFLVHLNTKVKKLLDLGHHGATDPGKVSPPELGVVRDEAFLAISSLRP